MHIMQKLKVLVFNLGYFAGLDGSVEDYLTQFYRYIRRTPKAKRKMVLSLQELLEREKPDVAFFMEVHRIPDFMRLVKKFPSYKIDNKYKEDGLLSKAPFFSRNCNVVITNRRVKLRKFYLSSGRKRLIYGAKVAGSTLLFGHFALGKRARARQFSELAEIVKREKERGNERIFIGGDFNTRKDADLSRLAEKLGMRIVPAGGTFPAHKPKHPLDLFMATEEAKVRSLKVLNEVDLSDHLPVILETAA